MDVGSATQSSKSQVGQDANLHASDKSVALKSGHSIAPSEYEPLPVMRWPTESSAGQGPIMRLPPELVLLVMRWLPDRAVDRLAWTCRKMARISFTMRWSTYAKLRPLHARTLTQWKAGIGTDKNWWGDKSATARSLLTANEHEPLLRYGYQVAALSMLDRPKAIARFREETVLLSYPTRHVFVAVTHRAWQACTLARFKAGLGNDLTTVGDRSFTVRSLPLEHEGAKLQAEALLHFAYRVPSFPPNERRRAIARFSAEATRLELLGHSTDALAAAAAAAAVSVGELWHHSLRAANDAVRRGGNVRWVAQCHAITTPTSIVSLEAQSVSGPAGEAVRKGENVKAVALRYGIFDKGMISILEGMCVEGPAGEAILAGQDVKTVVKHFGLTFQKHIRDLQYLAEGVRAEKDRNRMDTHTAPTIIA